MNRKRSYGILNEVPKSVIDTKKNNEVKEKRVYKKKQKIVEIQDTTNFLDEHHLFHIFKRYISPFTDAICSSVCNAECKQKFILLETLLLKNHLLNDPYYQLYGCITHGYYINKSIISSDDDKARFSSYLIEFRKIVKTVNHVIQCEHHCGCSLINLPSYFYNQNIMKWQPKPLYFCKLHNALHYCMQTTENCKRCYACASKKPCLFKCHYVKKDKNDSHICLVSKFNFMYVESLDEVAEKQEQYRRNSEFCFLSSSTNKDKNMENKILNNINMDLDRWIDLHHTVPYSEPLTIQSHFTAYLDEHLFAFIIKEKMEKKYWYTGIVHFISILRNISRRNYISIEWIPNFKEQCIKLWNILLRYFPFFITSKYCFSLIFYIQCQKGFEVGHYNILPLDMKYYPMLCHLVSLKPPNITRSNNISRYNQDFCRHLKDLSIEKQQELLSSIVNANILLFSYENFTIQKK